MSARGQTTPATSVKLTRTHRVLVAVVLVGAVVIAAIGFVGSYAAVRDLAERKGFGEFAPFFPIGIDAGIVVMLAMSLLLTWLRIPFPLLRQTAWLLTAATVAFNGAAAWGDPLAVGMHAIIPVLFIITVEAARHAIGRITDIAADRHMEGVRLWRWILAPFPTFRLWRRMKLWELRSYQEVIDLERDRLVYRARLRAQYGRAWRRRAPVEVRLPLKLAHLGVPLDTQLAIGVPVATGPIATQEAMPPADDVAVPRRELAGGGDVIGRDDGGNRPHAGSAPSGSPDGGNPGVATAETGPVATPAETAASAPLPPRAMTGAGVATAEQSRIQRVSVKIPEPASEPAEAGEVEQQYAGWDGKDAVRHAYDSLPAEERARSARALAPRLAEMTGLTQGTVRNYLGEIRREAGRPVAAG